MTASIVPHAADPPDSHSASTTDLESYWVAVKELKLSHYIGQTQLFIIIIYVYVYRYIYIYLQYGNLIQVP